MTTEHPTKKTRRGTLDTEDVLEVFRQAAARSESITLLVWNGAEQRHLYFHDGKVQIYAPGRVSKRLLHLGWINDTQVKAALKIQEQNYRPLADILVELGTVTREQMNIVVGHQNIEDLHELFSWQQGNFEFIEGNVSDVEMVSRLRGAPVLECDAVLKEVEQRAEAWERVLEKIYSVDEIFAVRPGGDLSSLTDEQQTVLDVIDGKRTVRELTEMTVLSLFECAHALRDLYERNLVVLANHVNTLGEAEECLQRGDHDYAVVILQPLLEHPEKNDLETMLEVARLLELCGKRRLAAEALIHAARLDYGAGAVDHARKACKLDTHSVEALQLVYERLLPLGRPDKELKDVSRRLIDARVKENRPADALHVLEALEAKCPDDTGLLHLRASILDKLDRRNEALQCLLHLAEILEEQGGEQSGARQHLQKVYQQILKIDRNQADVRHALAQLQARGLARIALKLRGAVLGRFRGRRRQV